MLNSFFINDSLVHGGLIRFHDDIVAISSHDGSKSDTDGDYNPKPSTSVTSSTFNWKEQSCSYTLFKR